MVSIKGKSSGYGFPESFVKRFASADSAALKVALFIMINGPAEETAISEGLGISPSAVRRSVEFWNEAGLFGEGEADSAVAEDSAPKPVKKVRRHMSQNEIAVALLGNEEYAALLQESQRLLGRELSVSESRLLIETVTEYSLPVPCILMIESYWLSTEKVKNVLNKTAYTVRDWSELGIRAHSEAEAELARMEESYRRAVSVSSLMKTEVTDFTKKDRRMIDRIFDEYGYDEAFISEVLTRKPEANLPYVVSVLKDWKKKGYRTISDVRLMELAPQLAQPAGKSDPADTESDFMKAVRLINEDR